MYLTDMYNIRIPRGDSAIIPVTFQYKDNDEPYLFENGQYAQLSVFISKDAFPAIVKVVRQDQQNEEGTVYFEFSPEETNISRYKYSYTIRLLNADGSEVDTWHGFPETAIFEIA